MYEEATPQQEEPALNLDIEMSGTAVHYLRQVCDWANIMAYFSGGFIALGLIIMAVNWRRVEAAFYNAYGKYESAAVVVAALFVLGYTLQIALLLYFSRSIKSGLFTRDIASVEKGVSFLKIYFMLSAIFGAIYLLAGVFNAAKLFF